jgi:hypothetical protein
MEFRDGDFVVCRNDAAGTMMKRSPRRRQQIEVIQPRNLLRMCSAVEPAIGLAKGIVSGISVLIVSYPTALR